jgi:CHAT domain-containing protein
MHQTSPIHQTDLHIDLARCYQQNARQLRTAKQPSLAREALKQNAASYQKAREVYADDFFRKQYRRISIDPEDTTAEQNHWATVQRVRHQATRKWLLEEVLPKRQVVGLSCYHLLNARNILDSALLLACHDHVLLCNLLYGDVDLQGLRLLVLSVCQNRHI